MKTLTGTILVVLGFFQMMDLQVENPRVGWTLTVLVIGTWAYEAVKLAWKSRR
jgi:hypothetical protein